MKIEKATTAKAAPIKASCSGKVDEVASARASANAPRNPPQNCTPTCPSFAPPPRTTMMETQFFLLVPAKKRLDAFLQRPENRAGMRHVIVTSGDRVKER